MQRQLKVTGYINRSSQVIIKQITNKTIRNKIEKRETNALKTKSIYISNNSRNKR